MLMKVDHLIEKLAHEYITLADKVKGLDQGLDEVLGYLNI